MFNRYAALVLAALVALSAAPASAQSLARQRALDYVQRNAPRHGLTQADVADLVVTDETTSRRSGVTHVYVRQQIGDVPVVAGAMTVNVARDGRVIHAAGTLVPGLALRVVARGAAISPSQAAEALAADIGLAPTAAFTVLAEKTAGHDGVYLSDGGVAQQPVSAALVYADAGDGTGALRLAYEVEFAEPVRPHVWLGTIDAVTGQVLRRVDRVIHDAFSGPDPAAVAVPAVSLAPVAAAPAVAPAVAALVPLAFEDAFGGAAYRVYAYPVMAPIYTTPLPPADARTLVTGIEDADGSPFGWHDTNGAAGAEFTTTRGNNTHSYTDTNDNDQPDPGSSPDGGTSLLFDFPMNLAQAPATYRPAAVTNLFYWNNLIHDIYYEYGFDEAAGNFQQNQYGRGGAATNDAVLAEAQDGGGFENANFYTPIDGGGGPLGAFPRMQMYLGNTATPDVDGDLDNLVIVHEYTHGLSIRLTGGPQAGNCLDNGEQMGEGWSDWYGLMVTMNASDTRASRRTVGNYLFGQPVSGGGIRPAAYSTSFTLNNYTYQRTRTQVVPHGVGFVWATILWEATWDMIDAHGFDPDVHNAGGTAGNQMMLNLVTEALKMQPCSPGFVDGRNAILAADEALYGGAHTGLLWASFARRGLGSTASQGSSNDNSDNTESFIEPEEIAPSAVTDLVAVPNGDYVTLTFTATGDDGSVGRATSYRVRRASAPILTEADYDAATPVTVAAVPAVAGTPEAVAVEGLAFGTQYHFALKVADESFNVSALSNSSQATTLAAPTATVPTAPIAVTTLTTATATLAIANAGPSDLRFSLNLEDTSARPATRAATPRTPAARLDKGIDGPAGAEQRFGAGGPDGFGYRWTDSNEPGGPVYAWVDISATGTAVSLSDDSVAPPVPLSFAFPYYGVDYSQVTISSNGNLQFGGNPSASYVNGPMPAADEPNNMLALFWDDLNPGAGGSVKYRNMGDGRFIVQYTGVPRYTSGTGALTAQIILSESGAITYQYQTIPSASNSATVGFENAAGTDGLGIVYDGAYLQNNLAIRIAALFVEADLSAGLIPAGTSQDIVLTFDATGLTPGAYTATLTVTTNSTNQPSVVIPLQLNVGTVADEGAPLAFEGTHLLGAVYPNPAPGMARVDLAVAEAQTVRVELYDALGRRVGVAFDGAVAARTSVPLTVDSGALSAGTYVLRIVGETFSDTRRITVVR